MRRALGACVGAVVLWFVAQGVWAHDSGFGLARYAPDGSLDRSFGNGGVVVIRSAQRSFVANALALQADGKIVLAGMSSDASSGSLQLAIARYNPDGTPDAGFASGGLGTISVGGGAGAQANAVALQPDGKILVAGTAFAHGETNDEFLIARFTPAGALDSSFGSAGVTTTHVGAAAATASTLAQQPDGELILVGTAFSNGASDDDFAVARYTSSGSLDTNFGDAGIVTIDFSASDPNVGASLDRAGAVALQPDAKIVVGGSTRGERQSFAVLRLQPDGRLDAGFGSGGKVQVAGQEPQVFSLDLQPHGDIVLAGSSGARGGTTPFTLVRLHPDGRPDEAFGEGGIAVTSFEGSRSGARAVIAQPDGKLIAGGARYGAPTAQGEPLSDSGFALARYNPDGSSDSSFGTSGRTLTALGDAGATALSLGIQPDGKILAAGLVFFQVSTAPPLWGLLGLPNSVMVAAAGMGLGIGAIAVGVKLRRGKK